MTKEACYHGLVWEKIVLEFFRKNGFKIKKRLTPDFIIELSEGTKVYLEIKSRTRTERTKKPSFKISREQYNKVKELLKNKECVIFIFILITDDQLGNETKILIVEGSILVKALKNKENSVKNYFSLFDKDIESVLNRNRPIDDKNYVIVRVKN